MTTKYCRVSQAVVAQRAGPRMGVHPKPPRKMSPGGSGGVLISPPAPPPPPGPALMERPSPPHTLR